MSVFTSVLAASLISGIDAASIDDVPLTRTPMIMTHDAATGYLGGGIVNAWAKTQSGPFADQLDCGARAFDARPKLDSSKGLIWHHGGVEVDHKFADSLVEIIDWCSRNPSELVILPISDCEGSGCMSAVGDALNSAKVTNIDDCSSLQGLTYGQAKQMAALPGGGSLLAVTGNGQSNGVGCGIGNYDPTLACTDDQGMEGRVKNLESSIPQASFDCWNTSKSKDVPLGRMLSYLDGVSSGGLSDTYFTQHQALWQESTRSVVVGTLRGSSLLKDEEHSGLNAIVTDAVRSQRWENLNMVEVNNVCDGGLELLAALRASQVEQIVI